MLINLPGLSLKFHLGVPTGFLHPWFQSWGGHFSHTLLPKFLFCFMVPCLAAQDLKQETSYTRGPFFHPQLINYIILSSLASLGCPSKYHSSGGWKSDIRVPAWSGEGLLPVSSHGRERDRLSHVSSYKGTNSIMRAPLSWPNHLPMASPPNTITLEIRLQHINFGRTQTFSP